MPIDNLRTKDGERLQKELYTALRTSVIDGNSLETETLVAVGARLEWLPHRLLRRLSKAMDMADTVQGLLSHAKSGAAIACMRRPWPAETAYRLAYEYGDFDTPDPSCLAIAACRGLPAAQHDLAVLFEEGCDIVQNLSLAVGWYRKAAIAGDSFAQNNLGVCLSKGIGLPFDGKAAVSWYRKSARQECAEGMQNYAFCLLCGQCVKRRETLAFQFALQSFLKDSSGRSAFLVGQCFRHGWGTRKNVPLAKTWLALAAKRGFTWKTSGWKRCKVGELPEMQKGKETSHEWCWRKPTGRTTTARP
jgi:hypothetical protein